MSTRIRCEVRDETPVTLVRLGGALDLAGSPADARAVTDRDPRAEGGRGLMLVRELTQSWGSVPAGAGKVVWAMLLAN